MNVKKVCFILSAIAILCTGSFFYKINSSSSEIVYHKKNRMNPYQNAVYGLGIVESVNENVMIAPPMPGLAIEVTAKVGEEVQKGDALYRLDDRDLQAQLVVEEAKMGVAKANLKRLEDQLNRFYSLNNKRSISEEDVRTKENDVAIAKAECEQVAAAIASINIQKERLIVRAPKSSVVLKNSIHPGEYVTPDSLSSGLILGDLSEWQLRVNVDEQNAWRVKSNNPAVAFPKGGANIGIPLVFKRFEHFMIPLNDLAGNYFEISDSRVLPIIYTFDKMQDVRIYIGQQMDVYIQDEN